MKQLIEAGTAKKKKFRKAEIVPGSAYADFYTESDWGLTGVVSPDWRPEPFSKIKKLINVKKIFRYGSIKEDLVIAKHPGSEDKISLSRLIERLILLGKYKRQTGRYNNYTDSNIIHYSITDILGYSHIQEVLLTIPKSAEEKPFEAQAPINKIDYKAIKGNTQDIYTLFILFNNQWSKGTGSIKQGLLMPMYSIDSRLGKENIGKLGGAFLLKFKGKFTEFHYFNIFRYSHNIETGLETALKTKLK